ETGCTCAREETSSHERGSTSQNRCCKEGLVGKAEGQGKVQKGYRCLQEIHWSQADECSYAEEIVGDDEGTVGGAKEGVNCLVRQMRSECAVRYSRRTSPRNPRSILM